MLKYRSVFSRLGLCVLCMALLMSMVGCRDTNSTDPTWTPPATSPTQSTENMLELIEKYIAEHFAGCEYVTVKKVLVDNVIDFYAWGEITKIVSSEDNNVTFTCEDEGSFGINRMITVETGKPVLVQFDAEFDTSLFAVHLNVFDSSGQFLQAMAVHNGAKQYEISLPASKDPAINLIISATGNETNVGQPIRISSLSVSQPEEKLSIAVSADRDTVIDIVENANLTSSRFYAAPNGDRYQLQVTNEGELVMVPIIPSKSLFIGNDLLVGFGFGMAASDNQHDYYYRINQAIYERNSDYVPSKISGSLWEACTTREAQQDFLNNTLAPNLSEDLELVVVQLGENVNTPEKVAVFAEGSREMLQFIRTKCPKARVVWVGAWYQTPVKLEAMKQACTATGCTFIDINQFSKEEYKNAIGNTWTDEKGEVHTITTAAVATHPNDEGFRLIANHILYKLGIVDDQEYYKE